MSYDIVLVSSGYDMIIRFWSDFNSGTNCKYQIEHKDNAINALEMTPAKDKVAFASGNSIKFLDLHKLFICSLHNVSIRLKKQEDPNLTKGGKRG